MKRLVVFLLLAAAPPCAAQTTILRPPSTAPSTALVAARPAAAKAPLVRRDNNAPINIAADKVLADLNAKSVTYTGNVVVTQGDTRMHADAMKVNTSEGKADTIVANGHVVVDAPSTGTATGDTGLYEVTARTVTLTGRVVLTKGKDVMRGTRLTVNLVTGQAVLGAAAPGQSGGRVQGVFTPNGGN